MRPGVGSDHPYTDRLEEVTVVFRRSTEKAHAVSLTDDTEWVWLPRQYSALQHNKDGTCQLEAPLWLLREKGLI